MNEMEKRPTGLLTATDELRRLVIENPDLPLLTFAGEDANDGDYRYTSCFRCTAQKGEFLDCMQEVYDDRIYTDRDDFREDIEYFLSDDFEGSDDEFDAFVESKLKEYEPYWRECIILYVDN